MKFADLRLCEPVLRAVAEEGYELATPIQSQSIPLVMEGKDLLGCAQTGTGKTAAFALPILHRLSGSARPSNRSPRGLVLCPTRELATQIGDAFRAYGRHAGLRHTVIFGGVGMNPQVGALRHGVDVVIATPGRLLDLMNQGYVDLRCIEVLVLDEADRMLDMGFINDIRKVVARVPASRQTLLFSATMPTEIRRLADSLLRSPARVQVATENATAEGIDQSVYFVDKGNKPALLAHLVRTLPMTRAIVFTRTKHQADRVVRQLHAKDIRAEAIHSNKSQNARQRALNNFRSNKIPVLVATDIASRGIDVDGITHVVNYDITHEPEVYVHRIGRTARAGASGAAVSFCDKEEIDNLKGIERLIRRSIPVKTDHPEYPPAGQHEARAGHSGHRQQSHAAQGGGHHPRHIQPHAKQGGGHPAKHPQAHAAQGGGHHANRSQAHASHGGGQRAKHAMGHAAQGGGHPAKRATTHANQGGGQHPKRGQSHTAHSNPRSQQGGSHAHSHSRPAGPHQRHSNGGKPQSHRRGGSPGRGVRQHRQGNHR